MGLSSLLRKLLPPEDEVFYTQFESSADTSHKAALLFNDMIINGYTEDRFIQSKDIKHRSNFITHTIVNQLNSSFVTPIDREDIQNLAFLMNKITKRIIRGCVNIKVYRMTSSPADMRRQAETLLSATVELRKIVGLLRHQDNMQEILDVHHRIQEIESHGDEVLLHATDDLFSGKHDTLEVIKLRDQYRSIESALDNCSNVADTIVNIALKHG